MAKDLATARVALAYDACQLAEAAGAAVPIKIAKPNTDDLAANDLAVDEVAADDLVADELAAAGAVLAAADRYLASVVAVARLHGRSWPELATALRRTETELRACPPLSSPSDPWWRQQLLLDPTEAATDLDDWVHRHVDTPQAPAPVSAVLDA